MSSENRLLTRPYSQPSAVFKSTVVVTNKRVLATVYGKMAIDVPFTDERLRKMQFSVEDGPKLLVSFDASLFQPAWSGKIEYRFNLVDAPQYLEKIQQQTEKPRPKEIR